MGMALNLITAVSGDEGVRKVRERRKNVEFEMYVTPLRCYGVTGWFDEGYLPKNGEVRFEGSRRPSGRTRRGTSRSTLHPIVFHSITRIHYE